MVARLSTEGMVELVKSFDRKGTGELVNCEADFDINEFVGFVEESDELWIPESSDGKISVVFESGEEGDYSRQSTSFDWHKDGLYLNRIPDFVLLLCESAGRGGTPTIFCDTERVVEKLSMGENLGVLEKLELVYVSKDAHAVARPLVENHPRGGNRIVNLGSRAFVRPSGSVIAAGKEPSMRQITAAMNELFLTMDKIQHEPHYWRRGEAIIFDNVRYVHGRVADKADHDRRLVRIWLAFMKP